MAAETKKVYVCRDVAFNETDFGESDHGTVLALDPSVAEQLLNCHLEESVSQDKVEVPQERNRPRRQARKRNWYGDTVAHCVLMADECEPQMMSEALKTPDADAWKAAAKAELESLAENHAWKLVPLPPGKKTIGCRWVFKVKQKEDGSVNQYKCHLIAKGYSQWPGIDYDETFSLVATFTTLRALITYVTQCGMFIHQIDVVTFLNGQLDEIYMDRPEGFEEPGTERLVCRLQRSLCGLKQSPHCWNRKLREFDLRGVHSEPGRSMPVPSYEWEWTSHCHSCIRGWSHHSSQLRWWYWSSQEDADAPFQSERPRTAKLHTWDWSSAGQERAAGTVALHQRQRVLNLLSRYRMIDTKPVSTPAEVNV